MRLQALMKLIFGAIVCGFLLALASGLVENGPEFSILENKYYGHPLVWRVTSLNAPPEYKLTDLALDAAFWIAVSFIAFFILVRIVFPQLGVSLHPKAFLLPIILFIPLGLIMDFIHEFGHVLWGVAAGGRFTYMKIASLEIYPRLAVTSEFELGSTYVEGLAESQFGLFQLSGSLTTNIAAWILGLVLLKTKFGYKTQIALMIWGLFGILDLPFYVIFPQMGLGHWIFLGGCSPEPLLGARKMGIPDLAFYVFVALTTFGLGLLYFKPLREKASKRVRALSGMHMP